jgi:hypothetical protein
MSQINSKMSQMSQINSKMSQMSQINSKKISHCNSKMS